MIDAFLSGLGVSIPEQGVRPCSASFPRKFNPYASAVWSVVVHEIPEDISIYEAWNLAVSTFIEACDRQGVFPFREQAGNNEKLLEILKQSRNSLLEEFRQIGHPLLDPYSVLSIDREASLFSDGFILTVKSLFKNTDPTFRNSLLELGFAPSDDTLVKRLGQDLSISFYEANHQYIRWYVEYKINGRMLPELPQLLATKEQLEDFLVKGIWIPLIKSEDPNHQGPRFI